MDEKGFDREYADFKQRLKGTTLLEHLQLQTNLPTSMMTRSCERQEQLNTVLGICRAWVAAKCPLDVHTKSLLAQGGKGQGKDQQGEIFQSELKEKKPSLNVPIA